MNIRDVLTLLFKYKTKILAVFLGTVLAITVGTMFMSPIYRAESTLMVKMGREYVYRPEIGSGGAAMPYDEERILESEIQILSSRDLLENVLESVGIADSYPDLMEEHPAHMTPLEAAIEKLASTLSFKKVGESNVIRITLEHPNPLIAANLINTLTELLMEKHLKIYSNPQASFLDSQMGLYKKKLENSQLQLQDFKQKHRLSSLREERQLLLVERKDLNSRMKSLINEREGLKSKFSSLKKQIVRVPQQIPLASVSEQQGVIDGQKKNLLELQLQEQKLSTKYRSTSRFVSDIRKEIQMVQQFLDNQEKNLNDRVTTGKNPVFQDLQILALRTESELSSLTAQIEKIQQQAPQLDQKLQRLDRLEQDLETLQLAVDSDKNNYQMYLAKVEEARVSEKMDRLKMANLSVIEKASIPLRPIRPNYIQNILLGVLLGGIGGIGSALVSAYLQGGYIRPEELAKAIDVPLLASISYKG